MITTPDRSWTEVGDGCFARRYPSYDLTVGAVLGRDGVVVIDTRCGPAEAAELRADLAHLTDRPVRWVVNTHWHFDHCFGNAAFADATVYAHEQATRTLAERGMAVRDELAAQSDAWARELDALTVRTADRQFSSLAMIDLGDRMVELIHPGRGHTDGDIVVHVPGAGVLYAGDLIEESGPPAFGDDSFPLEWPGALDVVIGMLSDDMAVVPGHGAVVGPEFVREQRQHLTDVADAIQHLASSGVAPEDAPASATWPFPEETVAAAVRQGYAALGGPAPSGTERRQLPLL